MGSGRENSIPGPYFVSEIFCEVSSTFYLIYSPEEPCKVYYFPILQIEELRGNLVLSYFVPSAGYNSGKIAYSQLAQ